MRENIHIRFSAFLEGFLSALSSAIDLVFIGTCLGLGFSLGAAVVVITIIGGAS